MAEFFDHLNRSIPVQGDNISRKELADLLHAALAAPVSASKGVPAQGKFEDAISKTNKSEDKISQAIASLEKTLDQSKLSEDISGVAEYLKSVVSTARDDKPSSSPNKQTGKTSPEDFLSRKDPLVKKTLDSQLRFQEAGLKKGSIYVHDFHSQTILSEISKDLKIIGRVIQSGLLSGWGSSHPITGNPLTIGEREHLIDSSRSHRPWDTFEDRAIPVVPPPTGAPLNAAELLAQIAPAATPTPVPTPAPSPTPAAPTPEDTLLKQLIDSKVYTAVPGKLDPEQEFRRHIEGARADLNAGKKLESIPDLGAMAAALNKSLAEMADMVRDKQKNPTNAPGIVPPGEDYNKALNRTTDILHRRKRILSIQDIELQKIIEDITKVQGLTADELNSFARIISRWERLERGQKAIVKHEFDHLQTLIRQNAEWESIQDQLKKTIKLTGDMEDSLAGFFRAYDDRFFKYESNISHTQYGAKNVISGAGKVASVAGVIGGVAGSAFGTAPVAGSSLGFYDKLDFGPAAMQKVGTDLAKWSREIHATLNETTGLSGDMSEIKNQFGTVATNPLQPVGAGYLQSGKNLQENFAETGQMPEVVSKELIKNLQRGITYESKWNAVTKQGLSLARLIGSEASSTADELASWHQYMDLSVASSAALVRNVQQVGRQTGVSADNLLQAVKSGHQLSENMRNAGTYTDEAGKAAIQLEAITKKRGTEKSTGPIFDALSGTVNLFDKANDKTWSLLSMSANASSKRDELFQSILEGRTLQTPGMGKELALGMEKVLMQFTGGKNVESLSSKDKMTLNLILQSAFGMQLGEFKRTTDTLKEGFATTEDKLKDVNDKLKNKNVALETDDRKDLTNQAAVLKNQLQTESVNASLDKLKNISADLANPDKGIAAFNKTTASSAITNALDQIKKSNLAKTPDKQDQLAKMEESLDNLTPEKFIDLQRSLDAFAQKTQVEQKTTGLDAFTAMQTERNKTDLAFQSEVMKGLDYIAHWWPAKQFVYADIISATVESGKAIVDKIAEVARDIAAIWAFVRTAQAFTGLMGGGGAAVGGGAAATTGTAAAATAGSRLMTGAKLGALGGAGYLAYKDYQEGGFGQATFGAKHGETGYGSVGENMLKYGATGFAIGGAPGAAIGAVIGEGVAVMGGLWDAFSDLNKVSLEQLDINRKIVGSQRTNQEKTSQSLLDANEIVKIDEMIKISEKNLAEQVNKKERAEKVFQDAGINPKFMDSIDKFRASDEIKRALVDLSDSNTAIKGQVDSRSKWVDALAKAQEAERKMLSKMTEQQIAEYNNLKDVTQKWVSLDANLDMTRRDIRDAAIANRKTDESSNEFGVRRKFGIDKGLLQKFGANADELNKKVYEEIFNLLWEGNEEGLSKALKEKKGQLNPNALGALYGIYNKSSPVNYGVDPNVTTADAINKMRNIFEEKNIAKNSGDTDKVKTLQQSLQQEGQILRNNLINQMKSQPGLENINQPQLAEQIISKLGGMKDKALPGDIKSVTDSLTAEALRNKTSQMTPADLATQATKAITRYEDFKNRTTIQSTVPADAIEAGAKARIGTGTTRDERLKSLSVNSPITDGDLAGNFLAQSLLNQTDATAKKSLYDTLRKGIDDKISYDKMSFTEYESALRQLLMLDKAMNTNTESSSFPAQIAGKIAEYRTLAGKFNLDDFSRQMALLTSSLLVPPLSDKKEEATADSKPMGAEDMPTKIAREMAAVQATGIVSQAQQVVSDIKKNTDDIAKNMTEQLNVLKSMLAFWNNAKPNTIPGKDTASKNSGPVPYNDWMWNSMPSALNVFGNIQSPPGY